MVLLVSLLFMPALLSAQGTPMLPRPGQLQIVPPTPPALTSNPLPVSLPSQPPSPAPNLRGRSTITPDKGVYDPRTGDFYPGGFGGVINLRTGAFYPKFDGGYLNTENGEFIPAKN